MPRKILVTGDSAEPIDFVEVPAADEHELQDSSRGSLNGMRAVATTF